MQCCTRKFVLSFALLVIVWTALAHAIGQHASGQDAIVDGQVSVVHVRDKPSGAVNDDVVVWLTPLDHVGDPEQPTRRYQMTQRNKQFHPHVLAVPVGAAVQFPNRDPWFHNVFSLYKGERFDLGLYETGRSRTVHFDRPGVSFIFCNIHPEMNAYILALETPYYATSDSRGKIAIANVPPGRYRLEVWYERAEAADLAKLSREVDVTAPAISLGKIAVRESSRLIPPHADKYGHPYEADRTPY